MEAEAGHMSSAPRETRALLGIPRPGHVAHLRQQRQGKAFM